MSCMSILQKEHVFGENSLFRSITGMLVYCRQHYPCYSIFQLPSRLYYYVHDLYYCDMLYTKTSIKMSFLHSLWCDQSSILKKKWWFGGRGTCWFIKPITCKLVEPFDQFFYLVSHNSPCQMTNEGSVFVFARSPFINRQCYNPLLACLWLLLKCATYRYTKSSFTAVEIPIGKKISIGRVNIIQGLSYNWSL